MKKVMQLLRITDNQVLLGKIVFSISSRLKRSGFVLGLTLLFSMISSSCEKDYTLDIPEKRTAYTLEKADAITQSRITKWARENKITMPTDPKARAISEATFDFEDAYVMKLDGSDNTVVIVNNDGYDISKPVNSCLAFFQDTENNNEIFLTFTVQTEKVSSTVDVVTYYDVDGKRLLAAELDGSAQTSVVTFRADGELIYAKGKRCSGQQTINCINDAYTNHGWVSVWAFVQSAFIPATAVAIAGACAFSC